MIGIPIALGLTLRIAAALDPTAISEAEMHTAGTAAHLPGLRPRDSGLQEGRKVG